MNPSFVGIRSGIRFSAGGHDHSCGTSRRQSLDQSGSLVCSRPSSRRTPESYKIQVEPRHETRGIKITLEDNVSRSRREVPDREQKGATITLSGLRNVRAIVFADPPVNI